MKMDGQTVHRTGPASWMPPANFGKLCDLVALIVAMDTISKASWVKPTMNGRLPCWGADINQRDGPQVVLGLATSHDPQLEYDLYLPSTQLL